MSGEAGGARRYEKERGLCDLLRVELEPGTANAPTVDSTTEGDS